MRKPVIQMRIHHLNCGTMYGYGFPTEDDTGSFFKRGHGVIHCLLVETSDGLVMVDTGWGTQDCTHPTRAVRQFMTVTYGVGDLEETAIAQITKLGLAPLDVKHIFLTHLHLDHAGGLPDFPDAIIHVFDVELEAYLHPWNLMERFAYRPEHRNHGPRWQVHRQGNDQWFGLRCLPPVVIGETEFIMVPFTGHTRGHCGVAIRQGERWLLDCGDAYDYYQQVNPVQPYKHPSGRLMETLVTTGFRMPRRNWVTIRALIGQHSDQIHAFCSHDLHEFSLFDKV